MGRRFKDVNVNQLNELMNKLNEKIKASCLKDALLFSQAYAAAEELHDIKLKELRSNQMTKEEVGLIACLKIMPNKNTAAILLESVIQARGPVSNEAGDEIRKILEELPND